MAAVTDKLVRWVINTSSQDHRWLGNDYFASQASHSRTATADFQRKYCVT
jgi:hypothetical protein